MVGVLSNKISKEDLKPGDHIYSWRHGYVYTHHGIYIGEGEVIHFTKGGSDTGGSLLDSITASSCPAINCLDPCPRCGDQSKMEGVIRSCIDCFLSGDELYLFQYSVSYLFFLGKVRGGTCTLAASDPAEDVLHRAKMLLENGFGEYHLSKNNCEDFAIYCKTSLIVLSRFSVCRGGQASSILAAANAVVSSPLRFLTRTTTFVTMGLTGTVVVGCGVYCVGRVVSDIGVRRDASKIPVEVLISAHQPKT
ncbi:protein LEAD-SENSITIVE 1-like isoform X2 [Impatiens glandulifera]|uniref:protein LEAD-SENSITIVE 1-like isoform X2 n=1 Tax=Impatiens glandulifera TaxID=253017 RepID=UPI001FB0E3BF|nr:protein LEAD-SENSITIVE 1-like isoform X2 [Impatiens glandulifera]